MDALPGDVILYPAGPKSCWSARLVVAGEIVAGLGDGLRQYSHAAIAAYSPEWQYEAKFPFTGRFKVDTSRPYEVWRLANITHDQRMDIVRWCQRHEGHFYNLIGVLSAGYINLPGTYYCSQFACLAYASVGLHPGDRIMSPDSIPQYPGAKMIDKYTPEEAR